MVDYEAFAELLEQHDRFEAERNWHSGQKIDAGKPPETELDELYTYLAEEIEELEEEIEQYEHTERPEDERALAYELVDVQLFLKDMMQCLEEDFTHYFREKQHINYERFDADRYEQTVLEDFSSD